MTDDLAPLTSAELDQLAQCEATIARGLQTFLEVGEALMVINTQRLYRQAYPSFQAYCQARWQMTKQRAYQLIDARTVHADLESTTVDSFPENESQFRALKRVPKEQRGDVWRQAVARYGTPNARQIDQIVKESTTVDSSPASAQTTDTRATYQVSAPVDDPASHTPAEPSPFLTPQVAEVAWPPAEPRMDGLDRKTIARLQQHGYQYHGSDVRDEYPRGRTYYHRLIAPDGVRLYATDREIDDIRARLPVAEPPSPPPPAAHLRITSADPHTAQAVADLLTQLGASVTSAVQASDRATDQGRHVGDLDLDLPTLRSVVAAAAKGEQAVTEATQAIERFQAQIDALQTERDQATAQRDAWKLESSTHQREAAQLRRELDSATPELATLRTANQALHMDLARLEGERDQAQRQTAALRRELEITPALGDCPRTAEKALRLYPLLGDVLTALGPEPFDLLALVKRLGTSRERLSQTLARISPLWHDLGLVLEQGADGLWLPMGGGSGYTYATIRREERLDLQIPMADPATVTQRGGRHPDTALRDQVRALLAEHPDWTNKQIAAAAGCGTALVKAIKAGRK